MCVAVARVQGGLCERVSKGVYIRLSLRMRLHACTHGVSRRPEDEPLSVCVCVCFCPRVCICVFIYRHEPGACKFVCVCVCVGVYECAHVCA